MEARMFCPITGKECDNVKNIHIVVNVSQSQTSQMYICQECAMLAEQQKNGIFLGQQPSLGTGLQKITQQKTCPTCKHTLHDITAIGKLGCPDCYTSFKAEVLPLLNKIQGNIAHIGKH